MLKAKRTCSEIRIDTKNQITIKNNRELIKKKNSVKRTANLTENR